jgi:EAL domain-containing protein (putative c-di-GMP-specific phosphodiesterase class I)/GGDEF domain-containing protein
MTAQTGIAANFAGIEVAVQAISNIHSGQCLGYELLLRGWERFGCTSAEDLIAASRSAGTLADLEIAVRRTAAPLIAALPASSERMLFVNLDHGIGESWDDIAEITRSLLGPHVAQIITEVAAFPNGGDGPEQIRRLKRSGGMVAIDRFGATADSLNLVSRCDPDFIKIDRTLIRGIDHEVRKRVLLAQLIATARILGIEVIAVGVETGPELTLCRELGCDLVQGNFVQPAFSAASQAIATFPPVEALAHDDRRRRQLDQKWVLQQLDTIPAIRVDAPMQDVFERFARSASVSIIPVVDHSGRALGIVREQDLKRLAYSAFGKDLIANKGLGRRLHDYVMRCPVADIATPLDQMLAMYATVEDADGILVTERMVYRGFLSARSIIRAMHEKTLARARDENPLTKLPGNELINEYVAECLVGGGGVLAYIDFDNFKPFNDINGFRQGDRAILLFAELARKEAQSKNWFVGHIGGDDFFIGLKGCDVAEAEAAVSGLIGRFAHDAESFYDATAREHGCIIGQDREGNVKSFPLLSASAVLLVVMPADAHGNSVDNVSAAIATYKHEAKASPTKLVIARLNNK